MVEHVLGELNLDIKQLHIEYLIRGLENIPFTSLEEALDRFKIECNLEYEHKMDVYFTFWFYVINDDGEKVDYTKSDLTEIHKKSHFELIDFCIPSSNNQPLF